MKKLLAILMASTMLFAMSGCGEKTEDELIIGIQFMSR